MKEERKKETLGQRFKKAREIKGFSLEEVSKRTKIHLKVLNAIEEDRVETVTNLFYARAFIKSYAQFLGVTEDEAVRQFIFSGAKKPIKQELFLEGEQEKQRFEILKIAKMFFVVFVIAALLLAGVFIIKYFIVNAAKHKIIKKPAATKPLKAQKKVAKKETVTKSLPEKEALSLTIYAKENCWLQLKQDGKIVFKGVLAKNKRESWHTKTKFELWVGDAGAIELELNGKAIGSPGKRGQVIKNITFTREGMKVQ